MEEYKENKNDESKKYIYTHGSTTEWCIEDKTLFYRTSYYDHDPWSDWNELPSNQFHKLNCDLIQNLKYVLGFYRTIARQGA